MPVSAKHPHLLWIIILVGATVGFRAGFFAIEYDSHTLWQPDSIRKNGWMDIADSLLAGQGYKLDKLLTYYEQDAPRPTAARGPVPVFAFSGILYVFGANWYFPVIIFSWLCSAVVACCVYALSLWSTQSRKLAIIASAIFATYMSESYISTAYATRAEPVFSLLFGAYLVALVAFIRQSRMVCLIVSSALLGLACLSRPSILLLPVVTCFILFSFGQKNRVVNSVLFCCVFGLVLAPWAIHNHMVFGKPVVSSTLGGLNLLRHSGMIAQNTYEWGLDHDELESQVRDIVESSGRSLASINEVELDSLLKNRAVKIISDHPIGYARMCAQRFFWIWYKQNSGKGARAVQNAIIYLCLIPGILFAIKDRNPIAMILIAHIAYFVSIHTLINAQFRFICPLMGYVIILAVMGGTAMTHWLRGNRISPLNPDSEAAAGPSPGDTRH